jgi:hypothetical protein
MEVLSAIRHPEVPTQSAGFEGCTLEAARRRRLNEIGFADFKFHNAKPGNRRLSWLGLRSSASG